ncbi:hypothetical protein AGABI2DRAFT_122852 [Agaricus bisporus var. bisporus H97]|uniref:hypothetical protein n=1 Tax=Agaricus bisporus var. bisporus (strain H97 / ATCC MYA-4626 / FGSC 10389) TaxID=936046 RepID=UPI00029F765E|nr:hypothetical protein AGABI2DRAFT_122852 [Agaricus bisporus var. bisporus H97]EKV42124.1 hypothetical protein AGABI2DRAFT_122852 [Agaricus bisporus var. bisporus H97]
MSLAVVYLAVVALLPVVSLSQSVTEAAVCDVPELNWTFNSAGKSPCEVATTLAVDCADQGFYLIPKLPARAHYIGPEIQNSCQCNTVYYSLLSACAACQGAGWISWPRFAMNCTLSSTSQFPLTLPPDVKVPGWAYADLELTSNNFSLSAAQNLAQSPESTGVPLAISTSTLEPSRSATSTSSATSTAASIPPSGSSSHAGIIAGSVVGGVFGLALIAGLLVYFLRHHLDRPQNPESATNPPTSFNHHGHPNQTVEPAIFAPTPFNPNMGEPFSGSFAAAFPSQKFYDPPESAAFPLPAPTATAYMPPPAWVGPTSISGDTILMDPRPGHVPQL